MSEQDEKRVYSLADDHYQWADLEDLVPEAPEVPASLRPLFPTGETVDEVDELSVYSYGGEAPYLHESEQAVEATPQQMAQWRAVWAGVEQAQLAFRSRLEEARTAYEATAREALADLAEATKPWGPVEAVLKAHTAELAAKLHSHRTAAKEWKQAQEEKKQAHLDTIDGPRVIVLYKPVSLSSRKRTDHVARVHLMECGRRPKKHSPVYSDGYGYDNDEGLRAKDAWQRLGAPDQWIRSAWPDVSGNLRVKFCSFCKPWLVFEEHLDGFPRPQRTAPGVMSLGKIRLTELPDSWSQHLMEG